MDSEQETQAPAATEGEKPSNESENSAENAPDYNDLKVSELKEKLKELGLPLSGKKSVLVERLTASNEKVDEENNVVGEEPGVESLISLDELNDLSRNELRDLRKDYHKKAEVLRIKRDELNLKSQSHASERNDLNVKAKEYMDNVHLYRDRRNGLNVEVGEVRDERREVSNEVNNLKDIFLRLKRKRFSGRNLPPVSKLRKQIQELEIKQMTTPLTTDKERALVDEIGSLQSKIREHDTLIETDTEKVRRELGKKMQKSRQEAQAAHHSMKDSLRSNRQTRRKADAGQRMFVKAKEKADEVHNEYINYLRGMQEIDRMTASQGRTGSSADQKASAASAEDLFAKFLAGEKLSTEQLMIIQKAGML
jgi:uncharacterized coiled-coil DUF342 family protein